MNPYLLLNSLSNDTYFVGVKFTVQTLSVGGGGGEGATAAFYSVKLCDISHWQLRILAPLKNCHWEEGGTGTGMAIFLF